jgi:hypothetical protein
MKCDDPVRGDVTLSVGTSDVHTKPALNAAAQELAEILELNSRLERIERKLDTLIKALAEDEPEQPTEGLGGERVPSPGQESRSL